MVTIGEEGKQILKKNQLPSQFKDNNVLIYVASHISHSMQINQYLSFGSAVGYGSLNRTHNFIMQKQDKHSLADCEDCDKKEKLIEKYLSLIDLLKKKSDKSLMSVSLRRSTDACTENNNSQPTPHTILKGPLAYALLGLARRRTGQALSQLKQLGLEVQCHKGYFFIATIQRILSRRVVQTAKKLFFEGGGKEGNVLEPERRGMDRSSSRNQSYCSLSAFLQGEKREKLKGLTRRVFELTQEVTLLRQQKRSSDELIEQNLRRQEVQSKKKKESLEMLAEQMAEKNETIAQLQAALRFYEQREGKMDNNVLEEDGLALKRELEKMEKLNEKLGVELQRKTEQLERKQEELSKIRQKAGKLEAEYSELKQKNFELGIEMQDIQKKRQEYASLSQFLEKKLNSLKKYERVIAVNLRAIEQASLSDRSSFNSTLKPKHSRLVLDEPPSQANLDGQKDFAPITRFQAQYKIEKILNYLYNIDLEDVWINNEEKLFDQEELTVLNDLKLKFIQLQEQLKNKPKVDPKAEVQASVPVRLSKQCGESDQIYFNQQHVSGSFFDAFASEKAHKEKQGKSVSQFNGVRGGNGNGSGEATTRRAEKGFTIKLLQMQIEKGKQVQKISQLKNKLFHIRSIVMNLIKSLQLKNLKPQSRDIIDVCFQFFEYSEEEKEVIFHTQAKKEKRFLGFF